MADGKQADIDASMEGIIKILGRKVNHSFFVLPSLPHEMILGMDILDKVEYQATIFGIPITPNNDHTQTHHEPSISPPPVKRKCALCSSEGIQPRDESNSERLKKFLDTELEKFKDIKGPTPLIKHHIKLKDPTPVKQRYQPRNPAMQKIIDEEATKMSEEKVIEPSNSPWSSPVVIARKKDGGPRFCVDFRRVNKQCERDAYPLPQINATIDKLRRAKYLSTIDLKNGYWQVELTEESKPLTAFTVPGRGLMQFRVLPFGLHSAPATFQRLLDAVIGPELEEFALAYLDDIIIASKTFDDHLRHLKLVFDRLRNANLKMNLDKCKFCVESLTYLGHVIDKNGIRTDPEKVRAITEMAAPTNLKSLRRFLGLISWYRRFIPDASKLTAPLNELQMKSVRWRWGEEQEKAFASLKHHLVSTPILACPDFSKPFILQTDASTTGLGACLVQYLDGAERVVAYISRTLNSAEKNYTVTELECLAAVWGIRKLRGYLEGYHFTIITDHQSLQWLYKIESPSGRLARWALELQQYDFDIKYRKGSENVIADMLSRQKTTVAEIKTSCRWYKQLFTKVRKNPRDVPDYTIKNGRLYKHIISRLDFNDSSEKEDWKLCVPIDMRKQILHENHDIETAGHLGIAKTLTRLAHRYYWPGMFQNGAEYVRNCLSCQKFKANQQLKAGEMHAHLVDQPWQCVNLDLVGPLPRSSNGHTTLLVMQDRFTKWVEARPLRRATAKAVTNAFKNVILHHGCPETVVTDNGKQFVSKEFTGLLDNSKITHRRTPPYTPQCNAVERTNRVLKTMIAQYARGKHKQWDSYIPEFSFAYNTSVSESTGYTPAYLNYGRELSPPGGTDNLDNTGLPTESRVKRLKDAYEFVKVKLAKAFQKQARYYNLRRRPWKPNIGTHVLKRTHTLSDKSKDKNAKLDPKYDGPYTVYKQRSPVIYDLKANNGKILRNIHVSDLKECTSNPLRNFGNPPGRDGIAISATACVRNSVEMETSNVNDVCTRKPSRPLLVVPKQKAATSEAPGDHSAYQPVPLPPPPPPGSKPATRRPATSIQLVNEVTPRKRKRRQRFPPAKEENPGYFTADYFSGGYQPRQGRGIMMVQLPDGGETAIPVGARKWTQWRTDTEPKLKKTLRLNHLHELKHIGPWKEHM